MRLLLLLCLAGSAHAQESREARHQRAAILITEDMNAGRFDAPAGRFTEPMRRFMAPFAAKEYFRTAAGFFGKVSMVGQPAFDSSGMAVMLVACEEGMFELKLALDEQDRIAGLAINPKPANLPVRERNETPFGLPFGGRWDVGWGGDTLEQNYHRLTQNQRFGFDFLVRDGKGRSYKGEGRSNTDYYAYGRDVVAPADGIVVRVIDGVPDNVPGVMDPENLAGNMVELQHQPGEYSFLGHLIPGSIRVKKDQRVQRGDVLGKCGNSGNSSEPHLHFHLQNAPRFADGLGVKVYFEEVVVTGPDGKKVLKADYSPVKDERISPE